MDNYTQVQKEIADKVRDIIFSNLESHITIAELAQEMHVSQTQVKVCFNRVYGMPVFSYARKARMEAAAVCLEQTQDSILEIAGRYGYENGSKFATAFRRVMGVSPSEYRKRYRWEQENGLTVDR